MQRFQAIILVAGFILIAAGWRGAEKLRIGTYDSRAIAIAYGNSSEGGAFVAALRADHAKAKAAQDDKLVKEIELKGRTAQVLGHLQAFSIGSVTEILAKHKSEVNEIAKEMKVEAIVSKHELMCLGSGVETVDVTAQLCKMFKPSEQAMKSIAEVPNHQPLPMLEVLLIPPEH